MKILKVKSRTKPYRTETAVIGYTAHGNIRYHVTSRETSKDGWMVALPSEEFFHKYYRIIQY